MVKLTTINLVAYLIASLFVHEPIDRLVDQKLAQKKDGNDCFS